MQSLPGKDAVQSDLLQTRNGAEDFAQSHHQGASAAGLPGIKKPVIPRREITGLAQPNLTDRYRSGIGGLVSSRVCSAVGSGHRFFRHTGQIGRFCIGDGAALGLVHLVLGLACLVVSQTGTSGDQTTHDDVFLQATQARRACP